MYIHNYFGIENHLASLNLKKKLYFMAPFYGWGSTASRLEPLRGGSLLFTTKFPEISGTQKFLILKISQKIS